MQVKAITDNKGRNAIAVQCNVQSDAAQEAAFKRHLAAWNCLDVAILNAGIFEKGVLTDSIMCVPQDDRTLMSKRQFAHHNLASASCAGSCALLKLHAVMHGGLFTFPADKDKAEKHCVVQLTLWTQMTPAGRQPWTSI